MECYPIQHKQTINKVVKLAHAVNIKYGIMAELLFKCGYRIGDIIYLQKRHISNGIIATLNIREKKNGIQRLFEEKDIPKSLINYLNNLKMNDFLFPSPQKDKNGNNNYLSYTQVRRVFKKIFTIIHIQGGYGMHVFRKTFATNEWKKSHNILKVQAKLGHSEITTTILYVPAIKKLFPNIRNTRIKRTR